MPLGVVDEAAKILRRHVLERAREQLDGTEVANGRARVGRAGAAAKRKLALRLGKLLLELPPLIENRGEPVDHLVGRYLEQLGRLAHALILLGEVASRALPGQRLDAADAGGDGAFANDLEETDIAGAVHMGAAAELDGIGMAAFPARLALAHGDDADLVAIFLAEQRQRALGDGLVGAHQMGLDHGILKDDVVGEVLDGAKLGLGHRPGMRKVESEAPGLDQRALLRHVLAQHLAQRFVQEMGRGVVGAGRGAARVIDVEIDHLADLHRAALERADMEEEAVELLLRVLDGEAGAVRAGDDPAIADLAAGLGIERRLVDDDGAALAGLQRLDALAVLDQRHDLAGGGLGLVTEELGGAELLLQLEPQRLGGGLAGARPGLPRLGALALHGRGEAFGIDADAARLQRILGQVEGKAVGVVELEGDLARKHGAARHAPGRLVEEAKAALERVAEAGLLELERLDDQALPALELGVGAAHLGDEGRHQAVEQRLIGAEQMGMAHGAAHDAAKHIAASVIGGQHAVGDEERRGAKMIGDDAVAGLRLALGGDAGELDRGRDQRLEQVDVVIVVGALQHGGDALEPHAGVDRSRRQIDAAAARQLVILHEDEIPDLDEAVAVGVRAAGWAALQPRAVVVEDLKSTDRTGRCRPWTRNCRCPRCAESCSQAVP